MNDVYFNIIEKVGVYEYGHSWVLRNAESNEVIKNSRMITGANKREPCPGSRTLEEVGINPGITILVMKP